MSTSITYRIKGLPVPQPESQPAPNETAPKQVTFAASDDVPAIRTQFLRALGNPRLTDVFYDDIRRSKLAGLWPSFTYLYPTHGYGPIKPAPVHLSPYLGFVLPSDADNLAILVKHVTENQESEGQALGEVLAAVDGDCEPPLGTSPLALSFASALFRGSKWLRNNRQKLLAIILQSSEAAYVALASGAWNDHVPVLLDRIAASPSLVLHLSKSPVLKRQLPEAWAVKALTSHPVYQAAFVSLQAPPTLNVLENLHRAAQKDTLAAGVALGLAPNHPKAEGWWQRIRLHGEALYWAGRAWHAGQKPMPDLPRHDDIRRHLILHPRWCYQWARDLEPLAAEHFVCHIWPSPWAVELIVDLQLPKDLVLDLTTKTELDENALWDSSILLWAADYVT